MKKRIMDLQRFAEGGEGSAVAEGVTPGDAGREDGRNEDLSNVIYGKQDDAADGADEEDGEDAEGSPDGEEPEETFDELIKDRYKDEFHNKVKDIIDRRFARENARTKDLEDRINAYAPLIEALAGKYGTASDPDAILAAIEEDSSFYEDEALERGITVEQLKSIKKIERENAQLKEQMDAENNRKKADEIYQGWLRQESELKEIYPDFDFRTEAANEDFATLIKNGIDLQTAYEVVHKDEIITGAMAVTAKKVKQQVADSIRANGNRPVENGINAGSGRTIKSDVSKLSKADRDEIEKRVMRGEKISF